MVKQLKYTQFQLYEAEVLSVLAPVWHVAPCHTRYSLHSWYYHCSVVTGIIMDSVTTMMCLYIQYCSCV